MATVNGYTAEYMDEIANKCIISGAVLMDDLILTMRDGTEINAGSVRGAQGAPGQDAPAGDVLPSADTLARRTPGGQVRTAYPDIGTDSANKNYVLEKINGLSLGSNVNLDSITQPGVYHQALNSNAATALNYPAAIAGVLNVLSNSNNMIWQEYVPFGSSGTVSYRRQWYNNGVNAPSWTVWSATNSVDSAVGIPAWDFSGGNGQALPTFQSSTYAPTVFTVATGISRAGGVVTIAKSGYYQVSAGGRINAGGTNTGERFISIVHDRAGARVALSGNNVYTNGVAELSVSTTFRALAGDVIFASFWNASGVSLNLNDELKSLGFSGAMIRAI